MQGSSQLRRLLTISSSVYGLPVERLARVAAEVSKAAHEITFDILMAEAEKLAQMVRDELNAQPPTWPELNVAYLKWKERMGLNTDMLKATEAYYNAIAVQEIRNSSGQFSSFNSDTSKGFSIRVGAPYTKHPGLDPEADNSNAPRFTDLATWLEYGTEHMPARPHWSPAHRRWKARHARTVKARLMSIVARRFKKLFRRDIVDSRRAKKLK